MNRSKPLFLAAAAAVLLTGAAAIQINSSKALQYYSGGDLDFKVGTGGSVDLHGGILTDSTGPTVLDGEVEVRNGALEVKSNLNMSGNSITEYFGSACSGDGVIEDVRDNGSFSCVSVSKSGGDDFVDEDRDSMTGYLNMTGSPVVNVGANNIDVGDGQGNIDMNGQRILDSSLMVADNIGITGSASTAETETNGNDLYVQDDVKVDGDFVGAGADVAERLKTGEKIPSATVVELGANMSVEVSDSARDTAVAGVVSRDPAMVMAKERDGVPIAMSGTVPVKFSDENGAVKPGDFLTTASENGHAMKCSDLDRCEGAIIGKAMQAQAKDGEVQMLISRG